MLEVIKYEDNKHHNLWNDFILHSNNGTIFHLRNFLSYHRERTFNDCSFIFYNKKNIEAVFTGAILDECLYSHPGASFGGFVYNELSFPYANQIVDALIIEAKKLKLKEIVIIPPPFIYYKKYNETMEYCLYSKGFDNIEYYISSFVNLETNLMNQMSDRKKRYIKKFEKEIQIKLSNDIDSFYPILINNKLKHKATPTHTLEELKILMEKFPNKIKLLLTSKDNQIIGGSLNFITNDDSCILFYNMINYDYQHLQIASIQIYESLKWAKKNNLKFLDIGVSQIYKNNQIVPHESLINFKEQFGAQAMIRKVMKLKL
tara:strand:+ start:6002 stop:6952 length:951 start_codon:yes stop_codon:yes gene_type:complete